MHAVHELPTTLKNNNVLLYPSSEKLILMNLIYRNPRGHLSCDEGTFKTSSPITPLY